MRTLAAALASLLVTSAAFGEDAPAPPPPAKATLKVEITNLRSEAGVVRAAVYRTEADYKNKNPSASGEAAIQGAKATVVLEGLEPGAVVVRVFHDEDKDGKIKTNWIGMPKEGVGMSRDAKGFMGPPKFDDAKLDLPAGPSSTSIKLHYL
ncbi:MAG TPA: DUF2141 domain-containing protein [Myxococcales bacterium]|jgi:uncharacterized protein (DUF2141 family)